MGRTLILAPWAKDPEKGQKIPLLHSVKVDWLSLDMEIRGEQYREIHAWCKENLKDRFYGAPAWTTSWQFENDEDATAFALRWVK